VAVCFDIKKLGDLIQSKNLFVFDFDGVIADSVEVKADAFFTLYKPYGIEVANEVIKHHRNNGGMPRSEKFKHYHKTFLGEEISESKMVLLSTEFSSLVLEKIICAKEILGVGEFLERYCVKGNICVINSATPLKEVKKIVKARGISHLFQGVYGSPSSKEDNLVKIQKFLGLHVSNGVFFGDARSDFDAAKTMGMSFIGVGKNIVDILEDEKGEWLVIDDFSGLINGA